MADSHPAFVWSSLAHIHGLPGVPRWAEWFHHQLESHKALMPLLGVGCQPVLIKGNKQQFLAWLGKGVRSGELEFPSKTGPIQWGGSLLADIFTRSCSKRLNGLLVVSAKNIRINSPNSDSTSLMATTFHDLKE